MLFKIWAKDACCPLYLVDGNQTLRYETYAVQIKYHLPQYKSSSPPPPPFHRPIVQCRQKILIFPHYKCWCGVIKNSMCQTQ